MNLFTSNEIGGSLGVPNRIESRWSRVWIALVVGAYLAFASLSVAAAVTVTITQESPPYSLSPQGDFLGVTKSKIGAKYTLVDASEGTCVTLKDAQGNQYRTRSFGTTTSRALGWPCVASTLR